MILKKTVNETHSHLLELWDNEKNIIKPNEITFGSHKKIFWKCLNDTNHSYLLSLNSKTSNKNGCPQCSGHMVSDKNLIAKVFPDIINEWDFALNKTDINQISYSSHKKIWLKCQNNIHASYLSSPNKRIANKRKCPLCSTNVKNKGLHITDGNDKICWINKSIKIKKALALYNNKYWELTKNECAKLLIEPCFYCKRKFPQKIGLDRIDNTNLAYNVNNCVPCCKFCNSAKLNLTIKDFKKWILQAFYKKATGNVKIKNNYSGCISSALKRNYEFSITKEQYLECIKKHCFYCKSSNNIGVDRFDNNLNYIISNIVPCCKICNRAKLTQTPENFFEMLRLLYLNINNF